MASPTVAIFSVLVGDLEIELLLERHHELDGIERVGAQVLDELGRGQHLVLLHSELLDDDLLHALFNRLRHALPPDCE